MVVVAAVKGVVVVVAAVAKVVLPVGETNHPAGVILLGEAYLPRDLPAKTSTAAAVATRD